MKQDDLQNVFENSAETRKFSRKLYQRITKVEVKIGVVPFIIVFKAAPVPGQGQPS